MKKISNLLILAVLAIGMGLTSCEGVLDDILGEWSRPTPGNVTPGKVTAVTITTAPTATADSILVGSTTALVTAGVADGGTVMYKVTTDNTQPTSTDGFSAEIPTAAALAVGTYFVWYYAKAADTQHTDSEIAATPIEVTVLPTLSTPLTLEAITAGTITVENPKPSMKFSLNGGAKSAVTANPINVAVGDKVQFYGAETQYSDGTTSTIFGGTAQVKVYGNIMSLLDETGYETKTDLPNESYVFCWLFYGNAKLTDASGLLLPAETLAESCYWGMFGDCTSLTAAPKLPAKTLAKSCYIGMFYGCTSLTTAPELKAETLAESCYEDMFNGCTSLTTAPELKATTLAKSCCYGMFHGCTSLTVAPELKAETLANNCYEEMFKGCTNLTTAPKLPATTLAPNCYLSMFQGCTSLTTAPNLPAETLASCCYMNMFNGCTNLTTAPKLPAMMLTGGCYKNMFEGCTKLTTAYVKAAYDAMYCIDMFKDCTATGTLHTTSENKSSWEGVMGSGKTWSTWEAVDDWTPLTLEAITNGTITVTDPKPSMKYSLNGGAKSAVTTNPINVVVGDKVQFYGAETQYSDGATSTIFGGTAQVKVYGNIMSLLDETDYETKTDLPNESLVFCWLFNGNANLTDASGLLLPAMTLTDDCYYGMFEGCTSLTAAPKLPAKTLARGCYYAMFTGCTSLTTAPELKAETLARQCYYQMFKGCTSLTTAPELKAETLAEECYFGMFDGCTALTTAPELKATTLARSCCNRMFYGCTSLTTAPELKAENLAEKCYFRMFKGCTALTVAPELKAETLAWQCCLSMFEGCTSLTTAYVKAAFTDSNYECSDMFKDCTATGTLHTTSGNKSSWDNVMGSGKTWSTWEAVGDWN